MNIRNFEERDLERLKQIHRESGFEYPFPDLQELFQLEVLVNDDDVVVIALGARLAAEMYMWIDASWETPAIRFEFFKFIHEHFRRNLEKKNIHWVHAWLPPQIAKIFGNRLRRSFQWVRSTWPCFTRRVF